MISVIVPIYNAEKYLCCCIDSILASSYTDYELLLIDDGSTDESLNICRMYVDRYSKIKCISIPNNGANYARKIGVLEATGDYIMFVDADDTIDKDALMNMKGVITQHPDADIIVGHMHEVYEHHQGYEYLIDLLSNTCPVEMFFKVYKSEVLKRNFIDIPRSLMYGEDLLQNINLARFVDKVIYCDIKYYNYRICETSVSHTFSFTQEYENVFHDFLGSLLMDYDSVRRLSHGIMDDVLFAWYRCRIYGLYKIAIITNKLNFHDSYFKNLKLEVEPYFSRLNISEKILLYSPHRLCIILLKLYSKYCILRQSIKN